MRLNVALILMGVMKVIYANCTTTSPWSMHTSLDEMEGMLLIIWGRLEGLIRELDA
jgi:hypothetical protein